MADAGVPAARVAKLEGACELSGPALLWLAGGELAAWSCDTPELVRLFAGDALAVPPGRRVRCSSRAGFAAEIAAGRRFSIRQGARSRYSSVSRRR